MKNHPILICYVQHFTGIYDDHGSGQISRKPGQIYRIRRNIAWKKRNCARRLTAVSVRQAIRRTAPLKSGAAYYEKLIKDDPDDGDC